MSAIQHVTTTPQAGVPQQAPKESTRGAWTPERVELLKTYASAGFTCMQIAREIGVTRNAVIGKLNRLGLTRRPRAARPHEPNGAPNGARERQPRLLTQRRILRAVYAQLPPLAATETIASEAPCTLLELTRDTCRWPIGDAAAKDFSFCGNAAVAGLSYCAGHARMAYRVPTRRSA